MTALLGIAFLAFVALTVGKMVYNAVTERHEALPDNKMPNTYTSNCNRH